MPNIPQQGTYIGTTQNWNIQDITNINSIDPELKEVLINLYRNLNTMALAINYKQSGMFLAQEVVTSGLLYFDASNKNVGESQTVRNIFRTTINFGVLPNAGTKSIAHDIEVTSGYQLVALYGGATNTARTSFIPLPFSSPTALNENIRVEADATDIIITTSIGYSDYIESTIIIEYVKESRIVES